MWLLLGGPKPSSEPITQNKLPSAETLKEKAQVEYYGETFVPFDSLPVYQATEVTNPDQVLQTIIRNYNLEQTPYSKTAYVSADGTISLNTADNNTYLELTFMGNPPESDSQLSVETARQNADDFLSEFGIPTSEYSLDESSVSYFDMTTGAMEYKALQTSVGADIIKFAFQRKLENLPVIIASQNLTGIQLDITSKGIYKVRMNPYQFQTKKDGAATLLTIDEALANVRNGDYSFLTSILRGKTTGSNTVRSLILSKFQLVYRLNLEDNFILPYYDFEGQAELANGDRSTVRITTPAVPSTLIEAETPEPTGHRE